MEYIILWTSKNLAKPIPGADNSRFERERENTRYLRKGFKTYEEARAFTKEFLSSNISYEIYQKIEE